MALLVVGSRLMTPPTWTPGAPPALEYIATQPFVVLHYAFNFLLPLNLVIDTDWQAVSSLSDDRVYAGLLFLTALLLLIRAAARTAVWRPVAFGLAWFLLTLAPTSLVPLGEVLNDHRPFFGTVGLCLAGTWALARAAATAASAPARFALSTVLPMALLLAHAWGVHQRNAVWGDDVVLWSQAAERAPLQGRNHLHHGTALMRAGKWQQALVALETAQRLLPDYPYIAINLGTTWGQLLLDAEAEAHFRKAIVLGPAIPDAYCFFAKPSKKFCRISHFCSRVGKYFAHLERDQTCQLLLLCDHDLECFAQDLGTYARCSCTPRNKRCIGGVYREQTIRDRCVGNTCKRLAGCWVEHVNLVCRTNPLAVNE
jgi:tetratricopeptide (TPR) repeat protein